MSNFEKIFTSIKFGTLELPNRIVMSPMVTHYATDNGTVTQRVIAYYTARAAGGVGLIATAFIGLPMVADMLILLGGGAAVIAIALVVIWLAIWLFIRMVIGWVRLLVRLGKRWCRKEIAA